MSEEFTERFGDVETLFKCLSSARISLVQLLDFLNSGSNFEHMDEQERISLYSFVEDRLFVLRGCIPLRLDSYIWLLDVEQEVVSMLHDCGITTIEQLTKRSDEEITKAQPLLTESRLIPLRNQITARLVKEQNATNDKSSEGA